MFGYPSTLMSPRSYRACAGVAKETGAVCHPMGARKSLRKGGVAM